MNHRMMILSSVGLLFAVSSCQKEKRSAFTDADRASVRALFDSTVSRVSRKDFAGWANLFTEDALFMPSNHPALSGRANLKAWADSLPPLSEFAFSDVAIEGDGDLAVGTSSYALTFNPPGRAPMPDRGKQLVAFHRQADGSWLVTAVSVRSDLPLPPAPPAPSPVGKK